MLSWGFSGSTVVKNPPANTGDTRDVGSVLGQEDPLQKEMATHLVFLNGTFHGQRSVVGYRPWGCKESDMTDHTHTHSVILHNHCAFINTKKLTLIHYCQLNVI